MPTQSRGHGTRHALACCHGRRMRKGFRGGGGPERIPGRAGWEVARKGFRAERERIPQGMRPGEDSGLSGGEVARKGFRAERIPGRADSGPSGFRAERIPGQHARIWRRKIRAAKDLREPLSFIPVCPDRRRWVCFAKSEAKDSSGRVPWDRQDIHSGPPPGGHYEVVNEQRETSSAARCRLENRHRAERTVTHGRSGG